MTRKRIIGEVVSDKLEKTVVVAVGRTFRHPRYGKSIQRTVRYQAHNTLGAKIGDRVEIEECRPISAAKHFRVVTVFKEEKA